VGLAGAAGLAGIDGAGGGPAVDAAGDESAAGWSAAGDPVVPSQTDPSTVPSAAVAPMASFVPR
jgi:hypothetical protein